ncbi:hypothetical protein [Actinospica robiniae]|uniref:hypothetical protein n=1 Tax=Actinospica robiniae TaxID=304901 RepID=UPI000411C58C|nr:hypothetical protein [Actinospica robiniae]
MHACDPIDVGDHGEPSVGWFDVELGTKAVLAPDFRSFVEQLTRRAELKKLT